jgi:deoxyribodipyrimidine photo-lyase
LTDDARVRPLNDEPAARGDYVLYWMQQSQRARGNPALEHAIAEANHRGLPVVVGFGLTDDYPEANERHYAFLLEGLADVARTLAERGVGLVVRRGAPDAVAVGLAQHAAVVVCDRGYLRHQRAWRESVAHDAGRRVVQVEGDVVVPVEEASDKAEVAARTLRPKIARRLDAYLKPAAEAEVETSPVRLGLASDVDPHDVEGTLAALRVDRSVSRVRRFRGGTTAARARLATFLERGLPGYGDGRSEPAGPNVSELSPYLHFGQISPVEVALAVRGSKAGTAEDRAAYVEELVVRRELAVNFVYHDPSYDRWEALPAWARQTLGDHARDPREHDYDRDSLERGDTHDPHWNAATREMTATGYMHNYMRMYWGKKILEWSPDPETAWRNALYLNNRWFLDGRDPNSWANVAWCFGLHDRPWFEREIFGKVRYMNASGLERKFDMDAYAAHVDALVAAEGEG